MFFSNNSILIIVLNDMIIYKVDDVIKLIYTYTYGRLN